MLFRSINELVKQWEWEKAIKYIDNELIIDPLSAHLSFLLGYCLKSVNRDEEAIKAYLRSIEFQPENEKVWNNLGVVYIKTQQYELAIKTFQRAIQIKPDYEKAWYNLGNTYRNFKQFDKSLEAFEKAIELKPDYERAWFALGGLLDKMDQNNKAVETFRKVILINPNNERSWNKIGLLFVKMQQYDNAIKAIQKSIEIKQDSESSWNNLGYAYAESGEYDKSIEAYKKSVTIKPDYEIAWNNLGLSYYEQNQLINAKSSFLQAIHYSKEEDLENTFSYFSNLLEVLFALNEFNEALSFIEKAFSVPGRFAYLTNMEYALMLLIKNNSESEMKVVFDKLLNICEKNNKSEQLSALMTNIVFALLRSQIEIKPFRMEMLKNMFENLFNGKPEFQYTLRYFDIGFRYFVKAEKEAIYEMSQEERKIFEVFTNTEAKY